MPKFYDSIPPELAKWAMSQPIFFIASAPTYDKHINVSPKGFPLSSFSIISPNKCAYIDVNGSGSETLCHIYENGRATIMFCSFEVSPRVLRFFCRGKVIEWDQIACRQKLLEKMKLNSPIGARAIIELNVFGVQTTCGYGVPYLGLVPDPNDSEKQIAVFHERTTLESTLKKLIEKEDETIEMLQVEYNSTSLDGYPGLRMARRRVEKFLWWKNAVAAMNYELKGLYNVAGASLIIALASSLWTVLILLHLGLIKIPERQIYPCLSG